MKSRDAMDMFQYICDDFESMVKTYFKRRK